MNYYKFKCNINGQHVYYAEEGNDRNITPSSGGLKCESRNLDGTVCIGTLQHKGNPLGTNTYKQKQPTWVDYLGILRQRDRPRRTPNVAVVEERKRKLGELQSANQQIDEQLDDAPEEKKKKVERNEEKFVQLMDALDLDDPDHVGEVGFSPEMRLFNDELQDPFVLTGITQSPFATMRKASDVFCTNVDKKGGRKSGKLVMGRSASRAFAQADHNDVPEYTSVTNRNKQHAEWCHLQADSLGGESVQGNFVAARYSANTYMMVIEHAISKQPYWAHVSTCGTSIDVPNVIEYALWRRNPVGHTVGAYNPLIKPDIVFRIDPKLKSFTNKDMRKVHKMLRDAGFSSINPVL